MRKRFFSAKGFYADEALSVLRILCGLFMVYHGWEVMDAQKMREYEKWLKELQFDGPAWMAFLGKLSELAGGLFLALGLLTRLALIPLLITMAVITFRIGHGRVFMEDQHPFLFFLLFLFLFFSGPGRWSLDHLIVQQKKEQRHA